MLRCRDVTQEASEYLDREMRFWPALHYRMHLLICVRCRRFVRNFRNGIVMVRRLHRVSVDQEQLDAVNRRIRPQKPPSS